MKKILKQNGWKLDHYAGGHAIYKKEGCSNTISLAGGKSNKMVWQRLVKENDLKI